ncbi:MAG TPA: sugar nucleotide-binding protein, partial [Verrucomicrobiae bacterium]|nr:sugar nucleotide-binding protein [Verrucomicrobiae bacterium]
MTDSAPKPVAWITGAHGLIGQHLIQTATRHAPAWQVRPCARADFDLLDFAAVEREFRKDRPALVIHCAAISTIADAQKNPDLARRVNVEATRFLSDLAAGARFILFSTDL